MTITHPTCGKSWSGLRAEHCPVCHETWAGAEIGDAHRVGDHGVTDGPNRRRCLSPREMKRTRRIDGEVVVFGAKFNAERGVWQWDDPRKPSHWVGREPQTAEHPELVPLAA